MCSLSQKLKLIARVLFVPAGTAYRCTSRFVDKPFTLFWDGKQFKNRSGFVYVPDSAVRIRNHA